MKEWANVDSPMIWPSMLDLSEFPLSQVPIVLEWTTNYEQPKD